MIPVIGADLETRLRTPGRPLPRPVCLSLDGPNLPALIHANDPDFDAFLGVLLLQASRGEIILTWHNASFDLGVLYVHRPRLRPFIIAALDRSVQNTLDKTTGRGGVSCSLIRENLRDIAEGTHKTKRKGRNLAALSMQYFDEHVDKGEDTWRMRYGELAHVPIAEWPEAAKHYAAHDAVKARRIRQAQQEWADRELYNFPTEGLNVAADFVLTLMNARGMRTDPKRAERVRRKLITEREDLDRVLYDAGILRAKRVRDRKKIEAGAHPARVALVKTTKKVQELIAGIDPDPRRTDPTDRFPDGQISCAAEITARYKHPILKAVSDRDSLIKSVSTYLNPLCASGGVVHPSYFALGAESERTSCNSPNVQNQPADDLYRAIYLPRPGYVFASVDFGTQELRCMAQTELDLFGDGRMAEAYRENGDADLHQMLADTRHDLTRDFAKRGNFGFWGGMGAATFAATLWRNDRIDMVIEEAEGLREAWFAKWGARRYFQWVGALPGIDDREHVYEHPRTGARRGPLGYSDTANAGFQTLAAAASKQALWEVWKATASREVRGHLLAFIHDENDLELEADTASEDAQRVARIMEAAQAKWTPDIPPRAEAVLSTRWSKCKPAFNNKGELIAAEVA